MPCSFWQIFQCIILQLRSGKVILLYQICLKKVTTNFIIFDSLRYPSVFLILALHYLSNSSVLPPIWDHKKGIPLICWQQRNTHTHLLSLDFKQNMPMCKITPKVKFKANYKAHKCFYLLSLQGSLRIITLKQWTDINTLHFWKINKRTWKTSNISKQHSERQFESIYL